MIKVTATYIGKDFSMGFRTNREYKLMLHNGLSSRVIIETIVIRDGDFDMTLPYESFVSFLKNWKDVSLIK